MDVKNKNRIGYKKTRIGWLPEEWNLVRLGEYLTRKPEYVINAPSVEFSEKLPTYLRITDISDDGRFIVQNRVSVNALTASDYSLQEKDMVFTRTGASTGKTYLYDPHDGDLVFAGFLIRVKPDSIKLIPRYLKAYTETHAYWKWINVMSTRSGQPGVNGKEYAKLPLPPLSEQEAIAGVLECWDKAIRNYEKKIEKKRNIKKGLMQRLLSGKQRLPGFSGEWKEVKLADVTSINEESLGSGTPDDFTFHYIDLSCVVEGRVTFPKEKILFIGSPSRARRRFKKNDILMSTVRPNLLGHCYVDFESEYKICSTGFAVISCKASKLDSHFLYNHLFGEKLNTDIQNLITGSNYPAINSSDVENLVITVPPFEEQQAVASVLSVADSEIKAVERKLALLRDQKKFLLNNLVTGTIRLPQFRGVTITTDADGDHA